ncbi:Uncharacterised protein family UPF0538 like protein [Aduncisulcus paluster]|uniref:Uncharacterized protein n=1 Tax=Aduncisulcus paluster TaxID=2918883 RepID=A0ABQ5JW93_9EUKA|nr:Uncharacterised protein family UPF0538 like protein [Aduncisulcus paluster]|eukprot:gnl/Carplike_NY0171/32306_a93313_48.p1 GENE.gnl/Carplike_NY0171/32306_a93313_48~~gnl/Carplike_NY0171/32306_a93313_48.p1  ORF type:complete len:126 (+),score=9.15 gnl/Carplike_NY0171/32306_a93313_48:30-407(+)
MSLVLTIRFIRSFEHAVVINHVVKDVDPESTIESLMEKALREIAEVGGTKYKLTKSILFDTMKLYVITHGSKGCNRAINLEDDDKLILDPKKRIIDCKISSESEISFFNMESYIKYKKNPVLLWK